MKTEYSEDITGRMDACADRAQMFAISLECVQSSEFYSNHETVDLPVGFFRGLAQSAEELADEIRAIHAHIVKKSNAEARERAAK